MGLPSKGRMAEDTVQLLKDCALSVTKPNPRQYVAKIPQIPGLEVWFQRASDVVRKLRLGDVDLGIVGGDMFAELADGDEDLVVVHDALGFGHCHLALGVPNGGRFASVHNVEDLRAMGWTAEQPLRVVTGYHAVARRFFEQQGFEHVALLTADGALEAAPAMGCADIILDLVSTGVTLKENNLREIEGGRILESQGVLVASRTSLLNRPGLLGIVRELIERLDGHLKAEEFYSVIANMRGDTPEEVAATLLNEEGLRGLQGPTISPVYSALPGNGNGNGGGNGKGAASHQGFWAAVICVPKKRLYASVKTLQKLGGSGVLVQPMTYIFDEEPARWGRLIAELGLTEEKANQLAAVGPKALEQQHSQQQKQQQQKQPEAVRR
jgi:ATP phosphoribosyltransferase